MWGLSASPLVYGDSLIVHAGASPDGCLLALDRESGEERWRSLPDPAGYSTPILVDHEGRRQLIAWTPTNVRGLDPETGELLWSVPFEVNYGTSIAVYPEYRGRGIGGRLYELRKDCVRRNNKAGIVAGGLIPGYADHKRELTPAEYVAKVVAGELYDATLTFQLENGFEAPGAIEDYITDPTVDNAASLIVWRNPDHDPEAR